MKAITVKLSEELHKELKIRLVEEGRTFNDYLVSLIEADMKKASKKEDNK